MLVFLGLFQESWRCETTESLSIFLQNAIPIDVVPYLYKVLSRFDSHNARKEEFGYSAKIAELNEKTKGQDERATEIFEKYAKLQGDYHNLIGIAAELVDSLERCVRGQMITPEYLQDICGRFVTFSSHLLSFPIFVVSSLLSRISELDFPLRSI